MVCPESVALLGGVLEDSLDTMSDGKVGRGPLTIKLLGRTFTFSKGKELDHVSDPRQPV
jgi:hypothetical protein